MDPKDLKQWCTRNFLDYRIDLVSYRMELVGWFCELVVDVWLAGVSVRVFDLVSWEVFVSDFIGIVPEVLVCRAVSDRTIGEAIKIQSIG